MSHAAMSAWLIGRPRLGVSACAATSAAASAATASAILRVDMLDLPLLADGPAGDAVPMLVREAQHVRHLLGFAARRHELGARGLHVAGLVPGAALQGGGSAVPAPRHAEARERLGHHRRLPRSPPPPPAA